MPGTTPKRTPANIARAVCGVLALIPPATLAGLPPWLSAILIGVGGACLYFTDTDGGDSADPPPRSGRDAAEAWRNGLRSGVVLPLALVAAFPLAAGCAGAAGPLSASHADSRAAIAADTSGAALSLDAITTWTVCADVRGSLVCTPITPSVYWEAGAPVTLCVHHPLIPVRSRCVEIPAGGSDD